MIEKLKAIQLPFDTLSVLLLCNVREPRGKINPNQIQCDDEEMFTCDEFTEIYQGLVKAGAFVEQVIFNEIDAIKYIVNKSNVNKDNFIVFNLARNGTEFSKKSSIPSFLDLLEIKYTNSDGFTCSLARNKLFFSNILEKNNIPTPKIIHTSFNGMITNIEDIESNKRYIVKPISSAASIGVNNHNIGYYDEIKHLLAQSNGGNFICQEFIEGIECEVPIITVEGELIALDPVALDLGPNSILTQEISDNVDYEYKDLNSIIPEEVIQEIKDTAIRTFKLLNMKNYGRVDFRISTDNKFYIFDISTTPYLTKHSSFNYAFKRLGLEYCDIFKCILKEMCCCEAV